MPLHKLHEFDPDYRDTFEGNDFKGMSVYSQANNEKIGTVNDVIVDDNGQFRYLVIDLGLWIFGKKVLLPVGRARFDHSADRVYVSMTKQQAESLPEYDERTTLDYDQEERVRGVYRASAPLEASAPLDSASTASTASARAVQPTLPTFNRDTYDYQHDASLYGMNDQDHQTLRLYEERLVAKKNRMKSGEVAIGKHVETETARVSVPIEKERVVIERVTPTDAGRAVAPGEVAFKEGEVAHIDIYEETADVRKEAFVREEVRVTKVVEQETVQAQETIRREELDVKTDGRPAVDRDDRI